MDEEDLQPSEKTPAPKVLETMSTEELEEYIKEMEGEIARAREMIEAKNKLRNGAESLFRK